MDHSPAIPILLLVLCSILQVGFVRCVDFRIIHRFSDAAAQLGLPPIPPKNSPEYHKLLQRHDLMRHGRNLLTGNASVDTVMLLQGNYTEDLGPRFGGIHYTFVDLGTPNVSFLVALDTGSDLLWIPCDCIECETVSPEKFPELKHRLSLFSTANSSTSKSVTCSNDFCQNNGWSTTCSTGNEVCPYSVRYLSENTSTSGKLIQDVIYLLNPANKSSMTAPIVFGCGQRQTGLFLSGGAPNGLLGLGPGDVSLPSMLAADGIINDTFSMCFDDDGSGRLVFGDRGAKTQQTTPFFQDSNKRSAYDVGVEGFIIGNRNASVRFSALFDTGTTLTYLHSEAYRIVTRAFDSQINLRRLQMQSDDFEFCYRLSGNVHNLEDIPAPRLSVIFRGGGNFTVVDPYIYLLSRTSDVVGFCLAMLRSNIPIIGQNFMGGYRLSFDRQQSRLGWSRANCYHYEDSATLVPSPQSPSFNQPSSQTREDSPFLRPSSNQPSSSGSSRSSSPRTRALFFVIVFVFTILKF